MASELNYGAESEAEESDLTSARSLTGKSSVRDESHHIDSSLKQRPVVV
jgi:hypothetical protein